MKLFDVYSPFSITPVRAEGCYVYDEKDQQYLDFYGGHAVISIGHGHPSYVKAMQNQMQKLYFYSNTVINPLQEQLAKRLGKISGCDKYSLFMCNSGAEANENALKLASFKTGKSRVIYFENSFHGRTSGAISVTDNPRIKAPFNNHNPATKLRFNDENSLEESLKHGDVAAVIVEIIQGVGGLNEASSKFYKDIEILCKAYNAVFIVDEIQTGWGRTGDFFAFQHYGLQPNLITMAKGMGNGFPVGGVLIDDSFSATQGMLGTTFGGNPMACTAALQVLEVIQQENLLANVKQLSAVFKEKASAVPEIKAIKGRGLMLGLEFEFDISLLRKILLYDYHVFTGAATPKNMLRILPPLTLSEDHIEEFLCALKSALHQLKSN